MKVDWSTLAARWAAGLLSAHEIPPIAMQALEQGCDSPSVAVLAQEKPPTQAGIREDFEAALRDLGIELPSPLDARRFLLERRRQELRRQIHDGVPLWPHRLLDSEQATQLVGRLQALLREGHVLHGLPIQAVAEVHNGEGLYIFELDDGTERVAEVDVETHRFVLQKEPPVIPTTVYADMASYNEHFLPEALTHAKIAFGIDPEDPGFETQPQSDQGSDKD